MTVKPTDEAADAALVGRLRAGDVAAIELLFLRYGALVYRVACAITGSADDAEDVVQDVFGRLPHLLRDYTESGTFVAWLRVTAARKALDRSRHERRRQNAPFVNSFLAVSAADDNNRIALRDAVANLPVRLRQVFVLRAVHGYSHAEIAVMLRIRRNASEVRYYRAVQHLRKVLAP